eukprot:TRINITY_DN1330_c0_g1_i4.p1 TRINITY_DN1330_c0_g1~~TRINITY_DN1330_c0_g1_i4.p1  ORF type:complete len:183 (+),score=39.52 TRINITY_DN1330_c0_g1_i4:34-582(+)
MRNSLLGISHSPEYVKEMDKATEPDLSLGISLSISSGPHAFQESEVSETPRKKLRLSRAQSILLEENFKEHSTLTLKDKWALASRLNLEPRQVEVWFQNRRARTKLKRIEMEYKELKQCCQRLKDHNSKLEKELQELRAMRGITLSATNSISATATAAAATLSICPSCQRFMSSQHPSTSFN